MTTRSKAEHAAVLARMSALLDKWAPAIPGRIDSVSEEVCEAGNGHLEVIQQRRRAKIANAAVVQSRLTSYGKKDAVPSKFRRPAKLVVFAPQLRREKKAA